MSTAGRRSGGAGPSANRCDTHEYDGGPDDAENEHGQDGGNGGFVGLGAVGGSNARPSTTAAASRGTSTSVFSSAICARLRQGG